MTPELLPYQQVAIDGMKQRRSTLLADEMGLGKTIEVIGLINQTPAIARVLIVCPATLKSNWVRELNTWLTRPLSFGIVTTHEIPAADILIINYETLARLAPPESCFDLLVVDECHYVKNRKTQRSKAVEQIRANGRVYLTGTPIPNRVKELWPILQALDPIRWRGQWKYFHETYCDAYQGAYGWVLDGAANLEHLQMVLRQTIMIRRLKRDVLKDLPPKRRQVVTIDLDDAGRAAIAALKREEKFRAKHPDEYRFAVMQLKQSEIIFTEMSEIRHATALAKVSHVIEHLRQYQESGAKVVCFAHHHDVIDAIAAAFPDSSVTLTGRTPMKDRPGIVARFQNDPAVTVFIGALTVAGTGITLTASNVAVFAELDWVPGNVTQAEDRLHRIGQRNHVIAQHLVFDASIDANMAHTLIEKQEIAHFALDGAEQSDRMAVA